jgi:hypothetical protein
MCNVDTRQHRDSTKESTFWKQHFILECPFFLNSLIETELGMSDQIIAKPQKISKSLKKSQKASENLKMSQKVPKSPKKS